MKKISYFILIVSLLLSSAGCAGYKPIFSSSKIKFNISEYTLSGDKNLGNIIYSNLHSLTEINKNDPEAKNIYLTIDISKQKNATSKDSAGKIIAYKINLQTKVTISDFLTQKKLFEKNFNLSSTYKIQSQYSETLKAENTALENIINKTYEDLLISISEKNI